MTPTDIPDLPAFEVTDMPAPPESTETGMLRAIVATHADVQADGISKVEVLARATKRLTEQVLRYGITEATLSLMRLYEGLYSLATGPEAMLVEDETLGYRAVTA